MMGSETLAIQCHRDHKFTPHFIVDILRPDKKASATSEARLEAAHLRLGPLAPLSPKLEVGCEARHQAHRSKKMRTTFTGRQIFVMEKMFETKKYLNANERSHLSRSVNILTFSIIRIKFFFRELCVTEQQVKIWFQNRRTKWKKQETTGLDMMKKVAENVEVATDNCDEKHKSEQLNPNICSTLKTRINSE